MDLENHAAGVRPVRRAWALALLLAAGCSHLPPLIRRSGDALDPREHVRLGESYEAQGLRAEAAAQYEAAARRDPSFVEAWVALGNLAFADGRLDAAEKAFRRAVKAAPLNPAALNNLAMTIMARGGRLDAAEAFARRALAEPGALRPYALETLANIRLRQKRYDEARDLVDQAEEATPAGDEHVLAQLRKTREAVRAAEAGASR